MKNFSSEESNDSKTPVIPFKIIGAMKSPIWLIPRTILQLKSVETITAIRSIQNNLIWIPFKLLMSVIAILTHVETKNLTQLLHL